MDKELALKLYHTFGLRQSDVEYLRDWPLEKKVRDTWFAYSSQGLLLSIGASLQYRRLVAVQGGNGTLHVAWPLWACELNLPFVLGFRWTADQAGAGVAAETVQWFRAVSTPGYSVKDRAWAWWAYSALGISESCLERGFPILDGRFRTTYEFVPGAHAVVAQSLPFE